MAEAQRIEGVEEVSMGDRSYRKLEEFYSRLTDVKKVVDRMHVLYLEETRVPGFDKVEALHFLIGDLYHDVEEYLYPDKSVAVAH